MFIGEYTHTLDPKKRLALPSKFRKELGRKAVVTHGLDNCLFVYPMKHWEKIAEKFSTLSIGQADTRGFNRFMLAGASEAEVDSMGRILIPEFLKEFAGLDTKVSVLGVNDRIEIWNSEKWAEYKAKIEKQADGLAEKLGEFGVI
ncbi:MAG TPA: division/cell wall cluster transcriptional repressor MraZ [Candidatus Paceibacterota bacterium]|nr:division/cell wall cluster transcriptional repressor MraZ [Candidatus Paceibacterota bacterium]